MPQLIALSDLRKDPSNPRKADDARMALLRLSLEKLGFILPLYATPEGMLLSGHQRFDCALQLGYETVPVEVVDIPPRYHSGINIVFNRCTNDFGALDTGSSAAEKLSLSEVLEKAECLLDFDRTQTPYALQVEDTSIKGLASLHSQQYDKKAVVQAETLLRMGVHIPLVISESGRVVNGVHRLFAARENSIDFWPVVRIPDALAEVALNVLNYLSMDFKIDKEMADLLRSCAFRRPQNNRGVLPKAFRFFANGHRTLQDKEAYSQAFWRTFRDMHGKYVLDFGAGLCKVKPVLEDKGIECVEFEPYRINMDKPGELMEPDSDLSRQKAREFLDIIAADCKFTSIFLASVMNSIPFPEDRMKVLAIVHSLCQFSTGVYGTWRDISDLDYEYGGIRQASYFRFTDDDQVRLGDVLFRPKLQHFSSQEQTRKVFSTFFSDVRTYSGGNIHYVEAHCPKRVNYRILRAALEFEFDLPYRDGTRMNLVEEALSAFGRRLGVDLCHV